MKDFLIGNARLVTRDDQNPYIEHGAVYVSGDTISDVGREDTLKAKYPQADWVDGHGGVIMPGMICTHNHIYSAFARGLSIKGYSATDFIGILEGQWWRIDRLLTLDETKWSAEATYLDCIKNGSTTVFDHHASYGAIKGSLDTIAEAAKKYGIRSCLCYEVSDRDGEEKMKEAVLENEAFILKAQKDESGMLKGMMGMHAPFTLSDETLEFCKAHTPEGAGYHIHVAEGIEDVHDSLKKYGKRTVERLFDLGILGMLTIAGHCIHVSRHEMDLLKETGTMVVHNPESNMGNAVGCGPVMQMVALGILTGLGTDGYTNDMFESYKVANILHKHHLCSPAAAWTEVPQMLFENNPAIAERYFKKPLGVIKPGAAADIIITDYIPDTPMDGTNANSHILFGMSGRSVITTIVNGEILMQDRKVLVCDEGEVLEASRESAATLWKDINA